MNQIFLGEPSQEIKNWFIENFPSWPDYTTLEFVDGTTQTKEIQGAATWQNIGVKSYAVSIDNTLKSCQLGNKVTKLSSHVFYGCGSLTSINIPNSVSSIGYEAFVGCSSLTSINIPDSVTLIESHSFPGCQSLTSINIPNSVTSIGDSVFENCGSLISINIPRSVSYIGRYIFTYDSNLLSVIFEGRTMDQIKAMENYPWGIVNTNAIIAGIS